MIAHQRCIPYTTPMETILLSQRPLSTIKEWLGDGSINIFGLPFSGKDTHGNVLAQIFDAPMLSSGDILRNSDISPELRRSLDAGDLFPTDEFRRIVTPYLGNSEFDGHPLILSSVGRWIGEEQGIIAAAQASGHPIKAAIYLHAGEEVVYRRFAKSQEKGDRAGRADDDKTVLVNRINEFNTKTLPVIEVYRQMGLLIEINSDAEKHEVLESILARLFLAATMGAKK